MTLYHAKARVRPASLPVEGRIACSIASAAARVLAERVQHAEERGDAEHHDLEEKAKTIPPAAASTPSPTSQRLRPMRSPQNMTPAAPTAVPAIPAPRTRPGRRVEPELREIDPRQNADQAVGDGAQETRGENDPAVADHASARKASPSRAPDRSELKRCEVRVVANVGAHVPRDQVVNQHDVVVGNRG